MSSTQLSEADFEIIQKVGEGGFGVVFMARKKSDPNTLVAIKQINKELIENEAMMKTILSEMAILEQIKHPFIVKFYGSYQTAKHLCIVLDFLAGGELFFHLEQLGKFTEAQAKFYAAEIALALSHLHGMSIIYRDLKPENIVLDSAGHVNITDFGLAKANVTSEANTLVGTAEYIAPEFLRGEGHNRAVDWWSLGILLYEMITGELPFSADEKDVLWEYILVKPLNFDHPALSEQAKSLLKRLLDRDAEDRLQSLDEFKKHPFFADVDFEAILMKKVTPPVIPNKDPLQNFHSFDE